MKKEYDFSKGERGAVISSPGKTRITIRIDTDTLAWFRAQCHKLGGGNYQTMINEALRFYINSKDSQGEDKVRRIIREELAGYSVQKKKVR
jgi:uncharacterized protein (DUF4415 family)